MVTLRRVGDVGAVGVAYHVPAGPHADSAPLQVLASILRTRPSGRLYKALVETKKAASVSAFAGAEHDPGLMELEAEPTHDTALEEVRDLLIGTVESVGSKGVTAEEVNRAKQEILKAREMGAANTSQIAVSLSEWAAQGDWRLYFLHRDRIEQVTPEAVKIVATRYLQRNNRTVGMFIPTEKAERVEIPPTPDVQAVVAGYKGRAAIPEGEVFDAAPANVEARVQRLELPEGIKVTLLPKKTRGEEVHALLTLHYGNEENLKGFEAAAGFLPDLMLRGTKKLSYQELRDELDRLKATISTGGGGGGRGRRGGGGGGGPSAGAVTFSIQAKRETFPAVMGILGQVLREPALPAREFEVMKRERMAGLEQMRSEPAMLAPRLLQRELSPYDKNDIRYVPTIEESIERLKAATHDQVVQLYREYLGSQAGELSIVGDFDAKTNLDILKGALAGWKPGKAYARIANPIKSQRQGAMHTIRTPDKANATYSAGLLFGMRDDDADYPALVLGNFILGGSTLSSRLGDRIRQKDGLSYGVSSGFNASAFDERAGLMITAICNPKNAARVQTDVIEEIERLLQEGVTEVETEKAKQGYLQSLRVARSSDAALAGTLSGLRYANRTMAYQAGLEQKIQELTPEQISAALRKHIEPKRLIVVTAGDFEEKLPDAVQ